MNSLLKILAAATLLFPPPAADDPPRPDAPVVGSWVLKSATVNGRATSDLSGLLKEVGGAEMGMTYRLRKDGFGTANDFPIFYQYHAETKELTLMPEAEGDDTVRSFAAKVAGKAMTLRFKEGNRTVVLSFAREE